MSIKAQGEFGGLQIRPIREFSLKEYSELLSNSFQNFSPSVSYLHWLYFENPRGSVRGYDAFDGDKLVAHYACIPIKIKGFSSNSLLSLNTATHPDYQGRGLFKELASRTFESYSSTFANVIGVANAKSVGGFIKHLGFQEVGILELRIGRLSRGVEGSRSYSKEELIWRVQCPGRPLKNIPHTDSNLLIAKPFKFAPSLKSIIIEEGATGEDARINSVGITLDWRRGFKPILKLPKRLKPSPLVLVFKPLLESDSTILKSFSFPDFDPF
jgi:hypothetical protein